MHQEPEYLRPTPPAKAEAQFQAAQHEALLKHIITRVVSDVAEGFEFSARHKESASEYDQTAEEYLADLIRETIDDSIVAPADPDDVDEAEREYNPEDND